MATHRYLREATFYLPSTTMIHVMPRGGLVDFILVSLLPLLRTYPIHPGIPSTYLSR